MFSVRQPSLRLRHGFAKTTAKSRHPNSLLQKKAQTPRTEIKAQTPRTEIKAPLSLRVSSQPMSWLFSSSKSFQELAACMSSAGISGSRSQGGLLAIPLSLQLTPRRVFSCSSRSLQSVNRFQTDRDKETAILNEYSRTYSENDRFTQRKFADELEEEEEETEDETAEDLKEEDTFGTLSNRFESKFNVTGSSFDTTVDSDEDEDAVQTVRPPGRRNTPIWYGNQMKKLIKAKKLAEAIEMLEVRMLKEDRVQPTEFNYDVLLGACGRAGYTKKAFKLYNQMKKRGLSPSAVTYTALFNACAESPWPQTDGITRLRKLHGQLTEKEIPLNQINQHAIIKAYAKCGDLRAAFDLFQGLLTSGAEVNAQSFAVLLFACAGNKEAGLMYGIEAWRQMLQRTIQPDIFTYNLLLRITRDCNIGDPELARRMLLKPIPDKPAKRLSPPRKKGKGPQARREDTQADNVKTREECIMRVTPLEVKDEGKHSDHPPVDTDAPAVATLETDIAPGRTGQLPNLLHPSPADISRVESLRGAATPPDRLDLLGGATGFLANMKEHNVPPDIKTVTLLAEVIPETRSDEDSLIQVVRELKVKVDVDFYNAIIRRRTRRADLEGGKAILSLIRGQGLKPNLRTYVNLACECSTSKEGIQLLSDMKLAGLAPTVHVYGALIAAAVRHRSYRYQTELLKCMEKDGVSPNERILERLETMADFGTNPTKVETQKPVRRSGLNNFRGFYITWLDHMGVERTPHPWEQFLKKQDPQPTADIEDQ